MTTTNSKNTKLLTLIILLLIILFGTLYMLRNYNKPKPIVNINNNNQQNNNELKSIITDQNEYINYKYNFGLSFPDYWKGFKAVEKDRIVEFSLENKNKEYVPIFTIGMYSGDELESSPDSKLIIIDIKGEIMAYLMKQNDQNLSEFGEVFASNSYSGLLFDVQNNIIPTLKFIKEGEIFDEKNKFQKNNEFRLIEIKVGDVLSDMTIKFIRTFDGYDMQPSVENQPFIDNLSVGFSGETTITGTYHNDKVNPQTGFGGIVCFDDLDEQSKNKIPSIIWSIDYGVFCFSNQDFAKKSFSPEGSTGIATIVIDDYVINKMPAEVTDMARLVKVVSKD